MMATLTRIDSTLEKQGEGPCSKAPCSATVKIDSVFGYGAGFLQPLSAGQQASARFAYTIAPTRSVPIQIGEQYPGLNIGSTFIADVELANDPDISGEPVLLIYGYERK